MARYNDQFNKVRMKAPTKNKFDLSHERKQTLNMGKLVPMYLQEVLPGDRFRNSSEIFMRVAPMLAPIFHRVDVWCHFFFVPNRIVWDEFEDFITGGKDGTLAPVAPYINCANANQILTPIDLTNTVGALEVGSLADYFGLPRVETTPLTPGDDTFNFSALPFRAALKCYNEYYRDQNLEDEIPMSTASGEITDVNEITRLMTLRDRAWEKDYFTSALPWAQRGPEVLIPMEGDATLSYKDVSDWITDSDSSSSNMEVNSGVIGTINPMQTDGPGRIENLEDVTFQNATVTINDLRRSNALQVWLEKNARGGARYTEQLRSHFNVISSDARLQRPEYLGGGKQRIQVSEVLSTYETEPDEAPLGTMAGHGIAVGSTNRFSRFFEEHGYIIGFMSVLPRTGYQDQVDRHWTRFDKLDYAWPEFAHIGEQEIKRREVYFQTLFSPGTGDETFGYTPRYAEYKFGKSSTHGEFKSSLSYWTMNRILTDAPLLNSDFVKSNPTYRIFPVTDPTVHHLYATIYNKTSAIRPLPYFGVPAL